MTNGTASAPTPLVAGRPPEPEQSFVLSLRLYRDYAQVVDFGLPGVALLALDEPPPLGSGRGPNPARVLGAAIGGCLGASLLHCLRKSRVEVEGLETIVRGTLARNAAGRLRVTAVHVALAPAVSAGDAERLGRCTQLFEDFCTVTESVREGIDVTVDLVPALVERSGR